MKRAISVVLAVVMLCGLLSVSALAAVSDYPKEFQEGKTVMADSDPRFETFLALQENGGLWAMGDISELGEKGPYSRTKSNNKYYTDTLKKIAEDVVSFQNNGKLGILKRDGSLWTASCDPDTGNGSGFIKKLDNVAEMSIRLFVLAVQEDGTLWAWGNDHNGQLGIGDRIPNPSADNAFNEFETEEPIKIMDNVAHVSASDGHSIALKSDGSVWAWGHNGSGQVGTGALPDWTGYDKNVLYIGECPAYERTPVKVMDDVKSIYAQQDYSMAIKKDGTLWYWGRLPYEPSTVEGQPSPVKLAEDVKAIFPCTWENAPLLILKNDNSLWGRGRLTDNYSINQLQKIVDNVASVTMTTGGALILRTDGTVWAIGDNYDGNLCDGGISATDQMAPHQGLLDQVVYLNRGVAIKNNGSLWVFGYNSPRGDADFFHTGADTSILTPIQLSGPANTPLKNTTTPPAMPTASTFTDVAATSPYYEAIQWAVKENITAGTTDTTFAPGATCTNAQILTFLWRAKGQPVPTIANPYTDVKESNYYYKAALWAYENGMVTGTAFSAATPATRSQTVTYLWTLAGKPAAAKATAFTDVDGGADYAKAVAWAVEKGITTGTSATTFAPDSTCTRGQIVTFLYRDLAK